MNKLQLIILTSLFLLGTVFGFVLTFTGKPYNHIFSTIHKLSIVAAGIFLAVFLWPQGNPLKSGALFPALAIVTTIFFIASIVSGAVLLAKTEGVSLWLTTHRITPLLATLAGVASILLAGKRL